MEELKTEEETALTEKEAGKAEEAEIAESAEEDKRPTPFFKRVDFCKVAEFSAVIFGAIVQLYIVAAYLLGMWNAFGRNINIVSAIDIIIQILNITRATIYRKIAQLLVGAVYLVIVGFLLRNAWHSCKNFFGFFKNRKTDGDPKRKNSCFYTVIGQAIDSFMLICVSVVVFGLFDDVEIQSPFVAAAVLVAIMVAIRALSPRIEAQNDFDYMALALTALKEILIFVSICLLLPLLKGSPVEKFINGCRMLFNGNIIVWGGDMRSGVYAFYTQLVDPVLSCVLVGMVLYLIHEYYGSWGRGEIMARSLLKTFIFVATCTVLHLVFHVFVNADISSFSIDTLVVWLNTVKSGYIPLLFLLGGLRWLELRV